MACGFEWSAAHLALFQRLTDEGLTCTQIGHRATAELGRDISRNVVIGLWNRGKVTRSVEVNARASHKDNRDRGAVRERKATKRKRSDGREFAPLLGAEPTPPPTIDDLLIPAEQRRTLAQLTMDVCKWPVGEPGDPDFFFCGAASKDHSSYCEAHHCRAYRPALTKAQRIDARVKFVVTGKTRFLQEAAE
jgi:GcrA cell cycle regulator